MGLLERTFVVTDDRYDIGAGLQEYNGTYSLCEAHKGERKTFLRWVYPQKFDQDTKENYPGDKALPKSVAIAGSRSSTIKALEGWIEALKNEPGQRKAAGSSRGETRREVKEKDDTIPF